MSRPLWLPWAIRKPIAAGANDPRIVPIGDVFHIAVSMADSLHGYFDGPSGGIESTGYIRLDGTTEQYRPFNVECDAQSAGNSFTHDGRLSGFNSWETEGMGDGVWTPEQLATIERIIAFKHERWGHPLVQCPAWNAPGSGYHRLFDQWNPNAHSCPGDRRVQQWNQIIVPWMRDGATSPEEDDMPYSPDDLAKIIKDATEILCPDGKTRPLSQALRHVMATQDAQGNALRRILAKANTGLSDADKADINKMLADAVIDVDVKVDGQ